MPPESESPSPSPAANSSLAFQKERVALRAKSRAALIDLVLLKRSAEIRLPGQPVPTLIPLVYPFMLRTWCGRHYFFRKATEWPYEDLRCACGAADCWVMKYGGLPDGYELAVGL